MANEWIKVGYDWVSWSNVSRDFRSGVYGWISFKTGTKDLSSFALKVRVKEASSGSVTEQNFIALDWRNETDFSIKNFDGLEVEELEFKMEGFDWTSKNKVYTLIFDGASFTKKREDYYDLETEIPLTKFELWNPNGIDRATETYIYYRPKWQPPNMQININGQLKTCDYGWVKIDGSLKQIDKIWTKINGELKEV